MTKIYWMYNMPKQNLDFSNSDQLHTLLLTLNICLKNLAYTVCFKGFKLPESALMQT